MTFYTQDSSFLTTETSAWYSLQKLDKAVKLLGNAKNELRDKYFLPPIRFKIPSLMSCTYNCVLESDLSSQIWELTCPM